MGLNFYCNDNFKRTTIFTVTRYLSLFTFHLMEISLSGKRAFIGGSSQGIGFAMAERMAACGASVTLTSRDEAKLKEAVAQLPKRKGQKHDYCVIDFGDLKKLEKVLVKYQAKTIENPVSILVLNSGGPAPATAFHATPPQYQAYFNASIMANQMLVQAFVPNMRERQFGRIITVLSSVVKQPKLDLGISNTIRAGIANWAKALSIELGGDGITVNNILPGFIQTARLNQLIDTRSQQTGLSKEKVMSSMAASIPAGRIGAPEDLGNVAAFLASDLAAYVNGVNVPVDGGLLGTL
jgi:3-oxoacyl-[acyl-carrier protein] reductase